MSKQVVESVKLATSGTISFLLTRAIAKADAVRKIGEDKYPGVGPALVSGGIFAGAVKMGKNIKDGAIRTGVIVGTGVATGIAIANVEKVKENLPPSLQNLLAGDSSPSNAVVVGSGELEQMVSAEAHRIANKALIDAGFVIENQNHSQPTITDSVSESTVDGDEDIYFVGQDEIYSSMT